MPTPAEQKALAFVAIVILLGGAVRVLRAGPSAEPTPLEQQALAHQASAVDRAASSRSARSRKTGRRLTTRPTGDTVPQVVGGVSSVPPSFARPDDPFSHTPYGSRRARLGFPPPSARIDSDSRGLGPAVASRGPSLDRAAPGYPSQTTQGLYIDIDVASEAEIDRLPRIGPVLARRIVANRDSFGPFRTLDGLRRVKGVGPATIARLSDLISFSGSAVPTRPPTRN